MTTEQTSSVRYPDIHLMLYGESGSGKSTFWAGAIRYFATKYKEPSLMLMFDPWDKATPYLELGDKVVDCEETFYTDLGIAAHDVLDARGNLIVRIEYYADPDPDNPSAYNKFERRMQGFEQQALSWASVGLDSMTFMQHATLQKWKKLNPIDSVKQQTNISWYGGVAEDAGKVLMSRAVWWRTNVCVMCHVNEDKDEYADFGVLKGVALTGKLSKRAPSGFGEVYRMCFGSGKDASGNQKRELQTRANGMWIGNSLVAKAPNPCEPDYAALWVNWRRAKGLPDKEDTPTTTRTP